MKLKWTTTAALIAVAMGTLNVASAEPSADNKSDPPVRDEQPTIRVAKKSRTLTLSQAGPGPVEIEEEMIPTPGHISAGQFLFASRGLRGKTLVVRSSAMDEKASGALEEDLGIMSRVLEKALGPRGDVSPGRKAMGIDVFSFNERKSPRNLYLEGYGALFMLNVAMPLVPPQKPDEDAKPKEPVSSSWEEARSEIYGREGGNDLSEENALRKAYANQKPRRYDAKKVEALKDSLLDALKDATHIRNLKAEDWVTVVVNGAQGAVKQVKRIAPKPPGGPVIEHMEIFASGDSQPESAMTLRAKKADIDAFAKGSLSAEEFRKKAAVLNY